MIKVDKGIDIPTDEPSRNPCKYPWRALDVGDSFFVPDRRPGTMSAPSSVCSDGVKFTFRAREENGVKGCRVWRIK